MAYVDYEYYKSLHGEKAISEADFNRLLWDAEREIDKATSGVDNVRKLKVAFPTNEEDAETVKRCVCALVEFLKQIEDAERNANSLGQYAVMLSVLYLPEMNQLVMQLVKVLILPLVTQQKVCKTKI